MVEGEPADGDGLAGTFEALDFQSPPINTVQELRRPAPRLTYRYRHLTSECISIPP